MLEIYHSPRIDEKIPSTGEFVNNIDDYKIINNDFDLYDADNGELVAKFRKRKIDKNINDFVDATRVLANRKKENRGASAGIIEREKLRQTVGKLYNTMKYRTYYFKKDGEKSKTHICNLAKSNVLGYIDTPIRGGNKLSGTHLSKYCIDYPERYKHCKPLINQMSDLFKELDYKKWEILDNKINDDYRIGNSVFSTVTINSSWQSATHYDSNNGDNLFACMTVVEDYKNKNDYIGGYFLLPEFKMAFNVRHGDIILCNTQSYLHCNSPLEAKEPTKIVGKYSSQDITQGWYFNRLSIVAYLKKSCIKNL